MMHPYPDIQPYASYTLQVEPPHALHVEECGNPQGIPVVFLHGGPGAGYSPFHRRLFDPQRYRIILFDQRGCGRSTPRAELRHNTTQALVQDLETLRRSSGLQRWLVFGGSWGATLALAYAEAYPEQVTGLILRGIFLCRPDELRWFYQQGASRIFPDYWQAFLSVIPLAERDDLIAAYHRRLTGTDEIARMAAAKAWATWEAQAATLAPNPALISQFSQPANALALARIECHYFMHKAYLSDNQLLRDAHRLQGIPGIIIHGRYDLICPLENAYDLHQAWPTAELRIIPGAGHAATEPGILQALLAATTDFAQRLS